MKSFKSIVSLGKWIAAPLFLLATGTAFAHEGHVHSVADQVMVNGMLHPLLGFDHWLALILIGVWATRISSDMKSLVLPAAFVASMALGLIAGSMGGTFHLLSSDGALLGLMITVIALALFQAPIQIAAGMVAVFGFLHGNGHTGYAAMDELVPLYLAGMTMMSALLHFGGWFIGRALTKQSHGTVILSVLSGIAGTALVAGG